MSASFPNAKKTFSAVVNGVTKLVAALFNSPYDEIEAEQTFIGPTGGGAQAYTTSLTDMLINYLKGCSVAYKGDADLYVRAGELMITDASGNRRLRRNPSDTTVTWSDIDTGSEATSTRYYVYAVADASATTFTIKISTSASAPSGCTYYRKIGSFYNNASGNISDVVDDYKHSLLPSGFGPVPWPTATPPGGWLICDGSAISRTTYADLFAAIGTVYGSGDGSSTFNIPNLKGKVPVGFNSSETEFDALGETGGEKTHTLTTGEIPSHTHPVTASYNGAGGSQTGPQGPFTNQSLTTDGWSTNNNAGGGGAHNNLQPYITVNYIIKY